MFRWPSPFCCVFFLHIFFLCFFVFLPAIFCVLLNPALVFRLGLASRSICPQISLEQSLCVHAMLQQSGKIMISLDRIIDFLVMPSKFDVWSHTWIQKLMCPNRYDPTVCFCRLKFQGNVFDPVRRFHHVSCVPIR
jgi:hypothetical protein